MNDISPSDPTYAEQFARLAQLIQQDEEEHGRITEMAHDSLRSWFNEFVQKAANLLGIAAGTIAAMVTDYYEIGRNAIKTAKNSFRDSYEAARRIKPL